MGSRIFSPPIAARRSLDALLLNARISRGDRLHRVGSNPGVEFGNLGRLGDKALVGLLGELGLNLDRRLNAARAEKLLVHRGSGGKSLLRIIARLGGDILQTLRQGGRCGGESLELVFGEFLEIFECRRADCHGELPDWVGFASERRRTAGGRQYVHCTIKVKADLLHCSKSAARLRRKLSTELKSVNYFNQEPSFTKA